MNRTDGLKGRASQKRSILRARGSYRFAFGHTLGRMRPRGE